MCLGGRLLRGCKTPFAPTGGIVMMSSRLSHFARSPSSRTNTPCRSPRVSPTICPTFATWLTGGGKLFPDVPMGTKGRGSTSTSIPSSPLAVDMGQAVIKGAIEEVLRTQLKLLGDHQPCPACARACPVDTESRTIQVRGGTIQYDEPVCHCPACRRDFFPSPPELAARLAQLLSGDPW